MDLTDVDATVERLRQKYAIAGQTGGLQSDAALRDAQATLDRLYATGQTPRPTAPAASAPYGGVKSKLSGVEVRVCPKCYGAGVQQMEYNHRMLERECEGCFGEKTIRIGANGQPLDSGRRGPRSPTSVTDRTGEGEPDPDVAAEGDESGSEAGSAGVGSLPSLDAITDSDASDGSDAASSDGSDAGTPSGAAGRAGGGPFAGGKGQPPANDAYIKERKAFLARDVARIDQQLAAYRTELEAARSARAAGPPDAMVAGDAPVPGSKAAILRDLEDQLGAQIAVLSAARASRVERLASWTRKR